jgi:hypothetical protein
MQAGGHKMRLTAIALSLALSFSTLASAETRTWFVRADQPSEAEVTQSDAGLGWFYVVPVRYAGNTTLSATYAPDPGHPEQSIPAGTPLFSVADSRGEYFCSGMALREIGAQDVAGVALGAAIFGGSSQRGMSRDTMGQCFRDSDNDGAFDQVAGGARDETAVIGVVQNLQGYSALNAALPHAALDVTPETAPLQLGLVFRTLPRRMSGASYAVQLCFRAAANHAASDCFEPGSRFLGARNDPFPIEISIFGSRILIDGVDGAGADARVRYRVERGFQQQRFTILSNYESRGGALSARSRLLIDTPQ